MRVALQLALGLCDPAFGAGEFEQALERPYPAPYLLDKPEIAVDDRPLTLRCSMVTETA